jgi:ferredoxin
MKNGCRARISIDYDKCVGSRICMAVAPNVFTLNEDSQAAVVNAEGDTLETIKMAAEACPVSAITIEETTE